MKGYDIKLTSHAVLTLHLREFVLGTMRRHRMSPTPCPALSHDAVPSLACHPSSLTCKLSRRPINIRQPYSEEHTSQPYSKQRRSGGGNSSGARNSGAQSTAGLCGFE